MRVMTNLRRKGSGPNSITSKVIIIIITGWPQTEDVENAFHSVESSYKINTARDIDFFW